MTSISYQNKCIPCGNQCCSYEVTITPDEKTRLEPQIIIPKSSVFKMGKLGNPCEFLQFGVCSVYDHRPIECKIYPYLFDITDEAFHIPDDALSIDHFDPYIDLICPAIPLDKNYYNRVLEEVEKLERKFWKPFANIVRAEQPYFSRWKKRGKL